MRGFKIMAKNGFGQHSRPNIIPQGSEGDAIAAWNRRAGGWIPVTERLPEKDDYKGGYNHVWAYDKEAGVVAAWLEDDGSWLSLSDSFKHVTHWRPYMPEAPGAK